MEDEIELSSYIYIVKKHLLLILAIFIVVVGAAALYTIESSPVYQAKALVLVTNQDQVSQILNQPVQRYDMQSQLAIISSDSILSTASQKVRVPFSVEASLIKDSSVIEIRTESLDRQAAADGANAVAEAYVDFTLEARKADALEVIQFVSDQIDTYKAELDSLNAEALNYSNRSRLSSEQQYEYAKLQQSISAKDKLYNFLLSKREEIGITSKQNNANIKIIQMAVAPVFPSKPNVPLNIALGIVLGLFAGLGVAFGIEYSHNTYKGVRDVEADFGAIVMGTLPEARQKRRKETRKHYFYQHHSPDHDFTDHLRMLRTHLMFYAKENNAKLVSVVSAERGDGKTTVATNLAMSLAKHNKKVLIVEANMRNPIFSTLFLTMDNLGFSDCIAGKAQLRDCIKATEYPNLYVLYAGRQTDTEILHSNRLIELSHELKALPFDLVIFDNTCLRYAESALVAAHTDGALFVVRHDKTLRDNALKAKEALLKVKAKVIGVVVNFTR